MKTIMTSFLIVLCASTVFATGGVKVNGDLTLAKEPSDPIRVLYFSNGTSQYSGQPWSYNNLDLYYLGGKIGIGTTNPSTELEVNGTVKANILQGNGAGVTNVTAATVVDGAITNAKITGPISAAKLDLSSVQKKYGKVAVVAQSGGDYTDPVTAMNSITAWCDFPSAVNPCLLKIMPGVYDIGAGTLIMQQYIDIEGSGENTTVITGTVGGNTAYPPPNGVVNGASNAEIRLLTVSNAGTSGAYFAAMVNTTASPKMTNVTLTATETGGLYHYGVYNNTSSPSMNNVTATASGATYPCGIKNDASSPSISNVIASASGGTNSYGVLNVNSSSPSMNNVFASVSGASGNYGIENISSSPTMNNVTATASGGITNIGMNNTSSSLAMNNVTARGTGGTNNYGLYNFASSGSYTILIDRSTFEGTTSSIYNYPNFTLKIGASKLSGGPATVSGTYICVGVYDGDTYLALNATCQ